MKFNENSMLRVVEAHRKFRKEHFGLDFFCLKCYQDPIRTSPSVLSSWFSNTTKQKQKTCLSLQSHTKDYYLCQLYMLPRLADVLTVWLPRYKRSKAKWLISWNNANE